MTETTRGGDMGIGRRWFGLALIGLLAACGGDDTGGGPADTAGGEADSVEVAPDVVTTTAPDTAVPPDTVEPVDTAPPVDTWTPPEPGEFGYPCDENDDCNSGWCVQTSAGRRCTETCLDECPPYFDCREAPGTDATFICIERFVHLCDPCDVTQDCNEEGQSGNYCLSYADKGKFCGAACAEDTDCPNGYVCRNVPVGGGGQATQCVPADGAECRCSELAKALQLSTTCFIENEHGKCEGTRFCTQSGLNLCDAPQPFPESCNGLDDNCNGQTDEFPPNYQCFIENEYGSCPGTGVCEDGKETCTGTPPAPEQCNLIDDDCDGITDNNLCDDQNPCTIDFCDDDGNCAHQPDDTALCDDGSVCTQVDKCVDGHCVGFNPLPCGDGNPCFDYQCDPVAGCLSQFANGAACEDGEPCTVNDTCNQGVCVPGDWDTCDDGNECTSDSCNSGQGCVHTPLSNLPCGGAGSGQCQTGTCANGQCLGVPINEGQPCTMSALGQCEEAVCRNGTCKSEPISGGSCDTGHSDCPSGYCSNGLCVVQTPQTCDYDPGLCEGDVPGTCTSTGECIPTADPSCSVDNCGGISFCCKIGFFEIGCCFSAAGLSCF